MCTTPGTNGTNDVIFGHVSGLQRNTFVTQLHATDLDSGENGQIYYEITNSGDIDNAFAIKPEHTGIVVTNVQLDVETRQDYRLIVSALAAVSIRN